LGTKRTPIGATVPVTPLPKMKSKKTGHVRIPLPSERTTKVQKKPPRRIYIPRREPRRAVVRGGTIPPSGRVVPLRRKRVATGGSPLKRQLGISEKHKIPKTLLIKIQKASVGSTITNPTKKGKKKIKVTKLLKKRAVLTLTLRKRKKRKKKRRRK